MSDEATGGTEHTVSQGDVSVHRTIETDGTGAVATVELRSTADEPVLVEVVEELPDDLPVESSGFKPEAMPDEETVSDDRLVLEQAVADEPEEVVYGLMLSEPVETIPLDAPTIEAIEPVAAGAAAAEDRSDVSASEADDGTEPDEPTTDAGKDGDAGAGDEPSGDSPSLSLSLSEPGDVGEDVEGETTAPADGANVPDLSATAEPDAAAGSPADRSTAESDGGNGPAGRPSVDIRLDRLSARVEEFAAYAESLGTLVDEHGTPPEFVDRFDERIDELDDRVASTRAEFREDVDEVGDAVEDVEEDVGEVETEVAAVGDETDSLRDDVDSLDDEIAALRADLDAVSTSMERVREETATLREELRELQAVRGSLAEALAGWASSPATDGIEAGAESDTDSAEASVVSDGGTTPGEDLDDEYTSAVTPIDPDD